MNTLSNIQNNGSLQSTPSLEELSFPRATLPTPVVATVPVTTAAPTVVIPPADSQQLALQNQLLQNTIAGLTLQLQQARQATTTVAAPTPTPTPEKKVTDKPPASTGELSEKLKKVKASLSEELKHKSVVLDAGHGGKDPGAEVKPEATLKVASNLLASNGKVQEKTLNLNMTKKVEERLEKLGFDQVKLTREKDELIPLADIAKVANKNKADVFVSIHHNSKSPEGKNAGIETYYSEGRESKAATTLMKALEEVDFVKTANKGIKKQTFGRGFKVLKDNTVIGSAQKQTGKGATLVELGYMSNKEELKKIVDPKTQDEIADALTLGIIAYLKQQKPSSNTN